MLMEKLKIKHGYSPLSDEYFKRIKKTMKEQQKYQRRDALVLKFIIMAKEE